MTDTYVCELVDSQTFLRADPKLRTQIIRLGVHTYENIPRSELVISNNDDTRLRHKQECVDLLEKELALSREKYTKYQTKTEEDLNALREQIDLERKKNRDTQQEAEQDWKKKLKTMREQVAEEYQARIQLYESRLLRNTDKVAEYVDSKTSIQHAVHVGLEGETSVEQFIEQHFREGVLENTTKNGGLGDFHFTYNGVRILIEVKNKATVNKPDVEKFKANVRSSKADAGVIVSLRPGVTFPFKKAGFDIEWEKHPGMSLDDMGVPLVFVTDFDSTPIALWGGLLVLYHYVRMMRNSEKNDNDMLEDHKRKYNELIELIKTWVPLIENSIQSLKTTTECMTNLQTSIHARLKAFLPDEDEQVEIKKTTSALHENIISIMISYKDETGSYPDLKYLASMGVKVNQLMKFGGLKELRKYCQSLI